MPEFIPRIDPALFIVKIMHFIPASYFTCMYFLEHVFNPLFMDQLPTDIQPGFSFNIEWHLCDQPVPGVYFSFLDEFDQFTNTIINDQFPEDRISFTYPVQYYRALTVLKSFC